MLFQYIRISKTELQIQFYTIRAVILHENQCLIKSLQNGAQKYSLPLHVWLLHQYRTNLLNSLKWRILLFMLCHVSKGPRLFCFITYALSLFFKSSNFIKTVTKQQWLQKQILFLWYLPYQYGKMVMVSVSDFSFPDVGTFFFFFLLVCNESKFWLFLKLNVRSHEVLKGGYLTYKW